MSTTRFNPPVPEFEARTGLGDTTVPDGDGLIEPGENDYSTRNRSTLRKYISSLTRGVEPTEGITPDSGPISVPHANPFPLNPDDRDGQFSDQAGLREAAYRDGVSGSPFENALFENIIKIGPLGEANDSIELSGHELLPGVVGSEIPNGAIRTVSTGAKAYITSLGQALTKKNLYSGKLSIESGETFEGRSFVAEQGVETGDSEESNPPVNSRVRLGSDSLGSSYDVANLKVTTPADLASIGTKLMTSAMGVDVVDYSEFKLWIKGPGGISQLDGPIRVATAAAKTSLSDLNNTMASGGQDAIIASDDIGNTGGKYTARVWPTAFTSENGGNYTGTESGQAAFSSFILGGTFVAAVLAAAILGAIVPAIAPASVPAEVNSGTNNRRKLKSGEFRYEPRNAALGVISNVLDAAAGIAGLDLQNPIYVPTNSLVGYGDCVVAGLAYFLGVTIGIDPAIITRKFITLNGNTLVFLGAIAARLAVIYVEPTSRQYYMGIIRELNRNTVALGDSIRSFGAAAADAAASIVGIGSTPSIFDSKLFKFVNTLAKIGDLAYTQAAAIDYRKTDIESDPDTVYSTFDPLSDKTGGQKFLMKGFGARRIYGDKIKDRRGVSYSLSDLPSYHLVPSGSDQSYQRLLGGSKAAMRIKSVGAKGSSDGRLRFSPEQVSAIESVLEAEYMPFYFHDLRTNEIVAFHAFLEDLSDSYQANYNNAGGYGRVEEIKTYKDTKRSVGCTFHVVATNPEDFDYMWWQINKLTTMVYPQWSSGRDLISKSEVGGGTADFKFTQPFSQIPTATPIIRFRVGDVIRSNYSRFNLKRLFGFENPEKKQKEASAITKDRVYYTVKAGTEVWVFDNNVNDVYKATITKELGKQQPTFWKDQYPDQDFEPNLLKIFAPEFAKFVAVYTDSPGVIEEINGSISLGSTDLTTQFYDSNNNAIIRSFETTRGYGLAAVVTQLQFTWMDGLWGAGEDGAGKRAPRSCKIQMSFDPIHDITPGLDHEGFNRAPIYPVGNLVNRIIEGGEPSPYGAGTDARSIESAGNVLSKQAYEQAFKQGFLSKLF